jgi:hypothetical protein
VSVSVSVGKPTLLLPLRKKHFSEITKWVRLAQAQN